MNSEWHYNFRTAAQLEEETSKFFKNLEAHRAYQEERRATRIKGETDTQKVKKALKAAGYNVTSVHRGSGTAYNWIEITIDDYDEYLDKDGYKQRHYGKVMQIAKIASGREHLHDDISTDLFMVNINVSFTKYHRCSECIISNCTEYHTPESCARGCFYSKEMAAADEIKREKWRQEEERKKIGPSLVDLQEDYDPNLPYIDGSDLDGATVEQDDIKECGEMIGAVPVKKRGIVAVPAPDNQVDLINTVVNCGAIITIPQSRYVELKEQGKTNDQIFDLVGSGPVKPTTPPGYIPYLRLSMVEEVV